MFLGLCTKEAPGMCGNKKFSYIPGAFSMIFSGKAARPEHAGYCAKCRLGLVVTGSQFSSENQRCVYDLRMEILCETVDFPIWMVYNENGYIVV